MSGSIKAKFFQHEIQEFQEKVRVENTELLPQNSFKNRCSRSSGSQSGVRGPKLKVVISYQTVYTLATFKQKS